MDDNYVDEYVVARSAESYLHEIGFLAKYLNLVKDIANGVCVRECPSCGGSGDVYRQMAEEYETCEVCNGYGKVVWEMTCRPYNPGETEDEIDLDIPF